MNLTEPTVEILLRRTTQMEATLQDLVERVTGLQHRAEPTPLDEAQFLSELIWEEHVTRVLRKCPTPSAWREASDRALPDCAGCQASRPIRVRHEVQFWCEKRHIVVPLPPEFCSMRNISRGWRSRIRNATEMAEERIRESPYLHFGREVIDILMSDRE